MASSRSAPSAYAAGFAVTALATVAGIALFGRDNLADVVMTYLLGLVVISTRFGFRVSVATAVLSVLAFDVVFIPPYLALTVTDLRHVVTFGVMLLVAVVIAGLTRRVKDQAEVARRSERRTRVLYAMSRDLEQARTKQAILSVASGHIEEIFEAHVMVFLPGGAEDLDCAYSTEGAEPFADKESSLVRWVAESRREAGLGTSTLPADEGLYLPLAPSHTGRDIGVLGISPHDKARFLDPEQRRLASALATQMAMAIERAVLSEEAERARLDVQAEQLKNTLLSSVSHDLRTPLAVMKGAASTLVDDAEVLPPEIFEDNAQEEPNKDAAMPLTSPESEALLQGIEPAQ